MVTIIGELGTMLVTASVVPSSPILVTLMKEAPSPSETSVLTRVTRCNIPEDTILQGAKKKQNLLADTILFLSDDATFGEQLFLSGADLTAAMS
jgi:hypothetical protein